MDSPELLKYHKDIYTYMKKKAFSYEGESSDEFKKYRHEHSISSQREFNITNFDQLLQSIEKSQIIYLGDFHSFDQSSRNMQRLLRSIGQSAQRLTLGIEFVLSEYQHKITQYLNHHITEIEFLESIEYHESWRFPWSYYKHIFELAKSDKVDILALNSRGPLQEREEFASNIVAKHLQKNPDNKLLILFGEYHIVEDKLPRIIKETIGKDDLVHTIIHQNLDEVYWNLQSKQNSNNTQVISFNDFEFSLQSSPPWIKYESMIYWYENLCNDPEFDIHEFIMEEGILVFDPNTLDHFVYLCEKIISVFDIELELESIEDFNLYDHQKIDQFINKANTLEDQQLSSFFKGLISKGRTFRLPFTNAFYCSNYSINRISFLAGTHIQNIILNKQNENYEKVLIEGTSCEKFRFFLYQFMMAYFSSKIINPYRKCDLYLDLNFKYEQESIHKDKKKNIKIALEVMEIIDGKKKLEDILKDLELSSIFSSSKLLGHYFGDLTYERFFKSNDPRLNLINEILLAPDFKEKNFIRILSLIFDGHDYKKDKKRFF